MNLKTVFAPLLSIVLCVQASTVVAEDGAALYGACVACHGAQGEGNATLGAPALAGQLASYTARQLNNFKTGLRGTAEGDARGIQMVAMANLLNNDAKVQAVAEYLAALPRTTPSVTLAGDVEAGRTGYNSMCSDCHASDGTGNVALSSPALVGLSDQYLFEQFQNFLSGKRGYDQADRHGRQMRMISDSVSSDAELTNLVAFIQTLSAQQ